MNIINKIIQKRVDRKRIAYPLSKDFNQLLDACQSLYILPTLPLKWFASQRRKDPIHTRVLKNYHVNSDLLTMMSILGLIAERGLTQSDLSTKILDEGISLSDLINGKRIRVQKLTAVGIVLVELYLRGSALEHKSLLFHLLMKRTVNARLPDFFARLVQAPELFDRELTRQALKERIHTKDPEIDHLISWMGFLGINASVNNKIIIIDRRWCIFYLFHSYTQILRQLIKNGNLVPEKYLPYNSIRVAINNSLHIIPSGLDIDDFFSILESTILKGKLSWEPDRQVFVGSGHKGDPKRARVSILTPTLPTLVKKEVIDRVADRLGLMGGK